MAKESVYHDLPYPFPYLPGPGEPVTTTTISEVALPVLRTVDCILATFGDAGERDDLTNPYVGETLNVLGGHLEMMITLLERFREEADGSNTPATP